MTGNDGRPKSGEPPQPHEHQPTPEDGGTLRDADQVHYVVGRPDPLMERCTPEELLAALRSLFTEEHAVRIASREAAHGLDRPYVRWSEDALFALALHSTRHREHIQRLTGWSSDDMDQKLAPYRAALAQERKLKPDQSGRHPAGGG